MMNSPGRRVAVFCSANDDLGLEIEGRSVEFAKQLALRGLEMIYGAGKCGLMGKIADAALAQGGIVRGAITHSLASGHEIAHRGITELVMVDDLFERKKWMMENADAFAILPGGFGTLDEALEVITWKALSHHDKPIVFLNFSNFWNEQLEVFKTMVGKNMIRPAGLELYKVANDISSALRFVGDQRGHQLVGGGTDSSVLRSRQGASS
jgi:uncharacterized protein (TIGR00730 family)